MEPYSYSDIAFLSLCGFIGLLLIICLVLVTIGLCDERDMTEEDTETKSLDELVQY